MPLDQFAAYCFAETTLFAFLRRKRRRLKDNKECVFGTFWSPFSGPSLTEN